jgi:hypothetical protein
MIKTLVTIISLLYIAGVLWILLYTVDSCM